MPGPAIPAATLVVLREGGCAPPDLLAVTRGQAMAFAGGALAFPGGRVDAADHRLAGDHGDDLAAWKIAAIRETLEETAIPVALDPLPAADLARDLQRRLHDGEDFAALLDEHALTLDLADLTPFARWKPAFAQTRIFDTIFFLAAAPGGSADDWPPLAQPHECESAEWASARDLLDRIDRGTAHAIFPTKRNLERLARFPSLAAALADAAAHSLDTITPWVEDVAGEPHVCIPQGRGYPVTSEPLATAFRA
ncbi:MAG TPA: NUDIX hydrolase [Sphingomicrobium sp.]|nr:NUDIX hydrolase [Sphingomicrobium sp.]